jgi:hypothetical protein
MKIKPLSLVLIGVGLIILAFVIGYVIGGRKPVKTEIRTEIVKDTVEANLYRDMYNIEKSKTDSLLKLKPKIITKYETIYKVLPSAPMPVIDSILRANAEL